jgi:competence protein ComFC
MDNILKLCKKIKEQILHIIFPIECISCKKPKTLLCEECLNNIPKAPFVNDKTKSIFHYKNKTIKKAVWTLKYHYGFIIAKSFGRVLADEIIAEYEDLNSLYPNKKLYIVTIPISPQKLKKRGYNQTEVLLNESMPYLNKELFIINSKILRKRDLNESQARVGKKKKRQQNIVGSMYLSGNLPKGIDILLIDDVVTTGATINEAKRVLKKIKPRSIRALTLAH